MEITDKVTESHCRANYFDRPSKKQYKSQPIVKSSTLARGKIYKVSQTRAHLLLQEIMKVIIMTNDVRTADIMAQWRDMCAMFFAPDFFLPRPWYFRPEAISFGNLFAVGTFFFCHDSGLLPVSGHGNV